MAKHQLLVTPSPDAPCTPTVRLSLAASPAGAVGPASSAGGLTIASPNGAIRNGCRRDGARDAIERAWLYSPIFHSREGAA
jgi:hypothetical protein